MYATPNLFALFITKFIVFFNVKILFILLQQRLYFKLFKLHLTVGYIYVYEVLNEMYQIVTFG